MPNPVTEEISAPKEELLHLWASLDRKERAARFQSLPREESDDFFLALDARDKAELILALPEGERRIWMRLLPPDDAADVVQLAPQDQRDKLLAMLDDATRSEVTALLAYKEDQAGGLMSPRFARLRPEMTVDEAIGYLRRQAAQLETMYYAYALDSEPAAARRRELPESVFSGSTKTVREVMRTRFISVTEEMDQEAVAREFAEHHLLGDTRGGCGNAHEGHRYGG